MREEIGETLKVKGNNIAIVGTGPIPGNTPIKVPNKTPIKQYNKFVGVRAIVKPRAR